MSCNINKFKKRYIITPSTTLLKGDKGDPGPPGDTNLVLPINSSDVIHNGTERNGELVRDLLNELLFTAITISSFSTITRDYEIGTVLTSIGLNWTLSKSPTSQEIISGFLVTPPVLTTTQRSVVLSLNNANSNFTISLTVSDGSVQVTSEIDIRFLSAYYTGKAVIPSSINSAFLISLGKNLATGRNRTFTVNLGANEYGWIAFPSRFGNPNFTINGFSVSMVLASTFLHTNESGGQEEYFVYRTEFPNLGQTIIGIS